MSTATDMLDAIRQANNVDDLKHATDLLGRCITVGELVVILRKVEKMEKERLDAFMDGNPHMVPMKKELHQMYDGSYKFPKGVDLI